MSGVLRYGLRQGESREALKQAIRRRLPLLQPIERRVLLWIFEQCWPADAPALQPLKAGAPEVARGVRANHNNVRQGLRWLVDHRLIRRIGNDSDTRGQHIEIVAETLFEVAEPCSENGAQQAVREFPDETSVRAIQRPESSDSPDLSAVWRQLQRLGARVDQLEAERREASLVTRGGLPRTKEASLEKGGGLPRFASEEGGGREEDCYPDPKDQDSLNPDFKNPPHSSLLRSDQGGGGGGQGIQGRIAELGPIDIPELRWSIEKGTRSAEAERLTLALDELFQRAVARGYVLAERRESFFGYVLTATSSVWLRQKKAGRPPSFIKALIINGDWVNHIELDELQRKFIRCALAWLATRAAQPASV